MNIACIEEYEDMAGAYQCLEIERLNEELKQVLEMHLQRMGARLPGGRRKGWREMFGGSDVSSTVEEARSYRR